MVYGILRWVCRILFYVLFRLEVKGKEHVPDRGPVILCSNHLSNLDPPLVALPLNRKIYFMAKEELFRIPIFRSLITYLGAYPVKRGAISKESIRRSLELLKEGQAICIFPEGTRGNTGSGKKGAASLSLKANVPVVPVAIIGRYVPFRKMKIVYGPPFSLQEYSDNSDGLQKATEKIMEEIYRLHRIHQ